MCRDGNIIFFRLTSSLCRTFEFSGSRSIQPPNARALLSYLNKKYGHLVYPHCWSRRKPTTLRSTQFWYCKRSMTLLRLNNQLGLYQIYCYCEGGHTSSPSLSYRSIIANPLRYKLDLSILPLNWVNCGNIQSQRHFKILQKCSVS